MLRSKFWFSQLSDLVDKHVIVRMFHSDEYFKSAKVRKIFLDYFLKDHTFVRSSPVINLNDSTTPFVNAGMNQFKGVFLGQCDPPSLRAVNYQKCIRVGGKHNDFEQVGLDGHHHTFFEMLGNWSFGDYFKLEACEYAWKLLTGPYGIPEDLLFITYFGGNKQLGLEPDLECKDIWLRLGVPHERILAFGIDDNFWEMGLIGPCGPCTEIHISERCNQPVNLIELWNIVFIQYKRFENGQIVSLPKCHVDTGLGLERLTAVLQGKKSNYDTDLFMPLFETMENLSKAPKYRGKFENDKRESFDTGYRILADHARMVTFALADGALPDQNPKLKRVLRNALNVSDRIFRKSDLLRELSFKVAEILGETYPELHRQMNQIQYIIKYEEEVLKSLQKSSGKNWEKLVKNRPALSAVTDYLIPGLVPGYNDLQSFLKLKPNIDTLPGDFAFKLYDTYGLSKTTISELAKVESLKFETDDFDKSYMKIKQQSKAETEKLNQDFLSDMFLDSLEKLNVPKTDDSLKYQYNYSKKGYSFPSVKSKLLGLIVDGNPRILSAKSQCRLSEKDLFGMEIYLILEKTPFYTKEGGQISDKGFIQIKSLLFDIYDVKKIRGYVFHVGRLINNNSRKFSLRESDLNFKFGEVLQVWVNYKRRLGTMRNHTATHLLNAALRKILPVIGQRGSFVGNDKLNFEYSTFGQKLTSDQVKKIEKLVNDCIDSDAIVENKVLNMTEMMAEDNLTVIPGEVYPDTGVRIVNIQSSILSSKEACCGTHIHRISFLDHFCILYLKSQGAVSVNIQASTGPLMRLARITGRELKDKVSKLEREFDSDKSKADQLENEIHDIECNLMGKENKILIPFVDHQECQTRLYILSKNIKLYKKFKIRIDFEREIGKLQNSKSLPFIIHCVKVSSDYLVDEVPLKKLEKIFPNFPVLVIIYSNKSIRVKCCVPEEKSMGNFNAQTWLESVEKVFQSQEYTVKNNNNSYLMKNVRRVNLSSDEIEIFILKAVAEAKNFANSNVRI